MEKLELLQVSKRIIKDVDYELVAGKSPPSESHPIDGVYIATVTAAAADDEEQKSDHRKKSAAETHSSDEIERSADNNSCSGSDEDDKLMKELKKVQRQNFLTHCLVSTMIVLTLTWQLSEVSMILKLKEGFNHPFRSLGGFIAGMFKRNNKPIANAAEDENPAANGKQKQGNEASSLSIQMPNFPLDLTSLGFTTEQK